MLIASNCSHEHVKIFFLLSISYFSGVFHQKWLLIWNPLIHFLPFPLTLQTVKPPSYKFHQRKVKRSILKSSIVLIYYKIDWKSKNFALTPPYSDVPPSDFELMTAMMQRVTLLEKMVRSQAQEIKHKVNTHLLYAKLQTCGHMSDAHLNLLSVG